MWPKKTKSNNHDQREDRTLAGSRERAPRKEGGQSKRREIVVEDTEDEDIEDTEDEDIEGHTLVG